jgi:lipopolysaccharide export system permease protein
MNRLDRYLAGTVATIMLLSMVGLLGILSLFTVMEEIENVGTNYRLWDVLVYTVYTTPRRFYELVPYSALIGCLVGLGLLASNSELTVMRASGVSTLSITGSVIKPTLVLAAISLSLGEFVIPDAERVAHNDKERALSDEDHITPEFGLWYREGNRYIHFDVVGEDGVLEGVSHYVFDEHDKLRSVRFARRAVYAEALGGWQLEGVVGTEIEPLATRRFDIASEVWKTDLTPSFLSTELLVAPDKLSVRQLSAKIDYMRRQGLASEVYELGFWRRVLQPLAVMGLVLVAISFVFGPLREASMGTRVVMGLVIGILFKFIQDLLAPASLVFGFSSLIATLIPILMCFVFGFVLLRRAA